MDLLTQAALGAVVGEIVLSRKLGWRGVAWGLFFGVLPDLDVLALPFLDPEMGIRWHRGLSHSILIIFLAPTLLAKPLSRCRWALGSTTGQMWSLIFWAWSTHSLIDCLTTYGTQIFEPFSDQRVALNVLFIVDPLFTLPLLIGLFLALRQPSGSTRRKKAIWLLSSASILYLGFAFFMKSRAESQITYQVKNHLKEARVVQVSPAPFTTLLWRGLIETKDSYYLIYWSPFDQGKPQFQEILKHRELSRDFQNTKVLDALQWFSRGHWVARQGKDRKLIIIDLRLPEIRDPQNGVLQPIFQWHLSKDPSGHIVAPMRRPTQINYLPTMKILFDRIIGDSKKWDALKSF